MGTIFVKSACLVLSFLLVGCGSTGGGMDRPAGETVSVGSAIESAICEGRAGDAVQMLTAEPLVSPTDRFFKGLAFEQYGYAVSARREYAALMQSGNQERIFLRCGREVLANGSVSDEAARRLAIVAQQLRAMDVTTPNTQSLPVGLPSLSKPATSTAGYVSSSPMTVSRPSSTSPLGRWFAHLASYSSYQNAQTNKPTLEKKFPALSGYIDQWEVTVGGGAVRLGVRLNSRDDANRLCNQVKSNGDYCAVLDTNS